MRKFLISIFFLVVLLFFFTTREVFAGIVTLRKDGKVVINVLAQESSDSHIQGSSLEVKRIKDGLLNSNSIVGLEMEDGEVRLTVSSEGELRELSLKSSEANIVEVEERPEVQRLVIGIKDGRFSLEQGNVVALTDYPIRIDAKRAIFSLMTPEGEEFLYVLPREAVEVALRTRLVTRINEGKIEVTQVNDRLQYIISGDKVFNFANLFKYSIPVSVFISGRTGEITSIDSPSLLRYLKFLFL